MSTPPLPLTTPPPPLTTPPVPPPTRPAAPPKVIPPEPAEASTAESRTVWPQAPTARAKQRATLARMTVVYSRSVERGS